LLTNGIVNSETSIIKKVKPVKQPGEMRYNLMAISNCHRITYYSLPITHHPITYRV